MSSRLDSLTAPRTTARMLVVRALLFSLLLLACSFGATLAPTPVHAQSADLPFAPDVNGTVYAIAVQADGRILIGGAFTQVNGVSRTRLARLFPDGSLDASFAPMLSGIVVYDIVVLDNSDILIGGNFSTVNGATQHDIVRLTTDGQIVPGFSSPTNLDEIYSLAVLPDGKYIGATYYRIALIHQNGSVDRTLSLTNGVVSKVVLLADGSILVGGHFTTVNGASRAYLARVNGEGVLDGSFQPSITAYVFDVVVSGGDYYVGSSASLYAGTYRNVLKFTSSGAIPGDFSSPYGLNLTSNIEVLPDGKILAVGAGDASGVWRLNANGTSDVDFSAVTANSSVRALAVLSDGQFLIGGEFTTVNGQPRNRMARLSANGHLETALVTTADNNVYALSSHPDGAIDVGGAFTTLDGQPHAALARITPTATVDSAFTPTVTGAVYSLLTTPDGHLLVGGAFSAVSGAARTNLARLLPDAALDGTFAPNPDGPVYGLLRQADGSVLVAGSFAQIGGGNIPRLARLDAAGSLDPTFVPSPNAAVRTLALQRDGKLVIGGAFTSVGGQPANRLARLTGAGAFDASFTASATGGDVYAVLVQPDGKIVVGGAFTQINGQSRPYLARLEANGALDASFAPMTTVGGPIYALALQPDGRLLVGGAFNSVAVDGTLTTRNRLARLDADGALDMGWNPNANNTVYALALRPDGKVFVGGAFTQMGGQPHGRIARLSSDLVAVQVLTVASDGDSVEWTQAGAGPELSAVRFYSSTDAVNYVAMGEGVRLESGWALTNVTLPLAQNLWIRAYGEYPGGQSNGSASAYDAVRAAYVRAADVVMATQVVGGASQPGDWTFTVAGKQVVGNATLRTDTGTSTVTYTGPDNYTLTGVSGACSLVNDVIVLNAVSGANTCTFTFTRDTGSITFIKIVEGGAAQQDAFSFDVLTHTVSHGQVVVLETGLYTVTESGPVDYVLRTASGACALVGGAIQLTVTKAGGTCTVNNTWPVTFAKLVEGGSALPSAWSFVVNGQTISPTASLLLAPGSYPVAESGPPRYSLVAASGDCALVDGAAVLTVPAASGSTGQCTLTNRRDTGTITFNTIVEGEGAVAADFTYTVIGLEANGDGGQLTLPTEDYTVSIAGPTGLIPRVTGGVCTLIDGLVRLAVDKTGGECTITLTRPVKFVNVVEGGTRNPASWGLRLGDTLIYHNRTALLAPGVYTPTISGSIPTYRLVEARDACTLDAVSQTLTLTAPGNGQCTVVHRRVTGDVTFTRVVRGGSAQPADWVTMVSGQPMPLDTPTAIATNTYIVTESGPPDYVITTVSGICTLDRGQIKLTVTEEGGECALISTRGIGPVGFVMFPGGGNAQASEWSFVVNGQVVPHNGALLMPIGLYTVTVQGPAGYTVIGASGICNLTASGDVQMTVGVEGGTCNLQSAYGAGGTGAIGFYAAPSNDAPPEMWNFVANGQAADHNQMLLMPVGVYTVTVNGPEGYHVAGATGVCSLVDGTVQLNVTAFGGACTVQTAPDAAPPSDFALFLPAVTR